MGTEPTVIQTKRHRQAFTIFKKGAREEINSLAQQTLHLFDFVFNCVWYSLSFHCLCVSAGFFSAFASRAIKNN